MGKFTGVTFVLGAITGFGFGLLPAPEEQATQQLASVARIATERAPAGSAEPTTRSHVEVDPRVIPVRSPARGDAPVVAQAGSPVVQSVPGSPSRLSSVRPGDESSRRALAKSIQSELQRVGCYEGDADGSWSPATRRAMKAFIERVNATLPFEEPDYILLTLVQGYAGQACGAGCPPGQVLAKGDKCEPRAVVAQGRRSPAPTVAAAPPAQPAFRTQQPAKEPLPGRMGAGALDAAAATPAGGEAGRDRVAALPTGPAGPASITPTSPSPTTLETGALLGQPQDAPNQPAGSPDLVTAQPQPTGRRSNAKRGPTPKPTVAARPAPPPARPASSSHASVFARLQLNAP